MCEQCVDWDRMVREGKKDWIVESANFSIAYRAGDKNRLTVVLKDDNQIYAFESASPIRGDRPSMKEVVELLNEKHSN